VNPLIESQLYAIYPGLIKSMDDSNDSVRIKTSEVIYEYLNCLPSSCERQDFNDIMKSLLIHLDDSNNLLQEAVTSAIRAAILLNPKLCLEYITTVHPHQHTPEYCERLIDYAKSL